MTSHFAARMFRGRGSRLGELRLGIRRIFCYGFRRFLVGREREVVVVAAAAAVVAAAAAAAAVVVSVDSLLLWWVPPGALCLELVVQPVGLPVVLRPGLTHVAPALELVVALRRLQHEVLELICARWDPVATPREGCELALDPAACVDVEHEAVELVVEARGLKQSPW